MAAALNTKKNYNPSKNAYINNVRKKEKRRRRKREKKGKRFRNKEKLIKINLVLFDIDMKE